MEIGSSTDKEISETGSVKGSLARTLKKHQEESGRSIYELSNSSGVDAAYIWRIIRGERTNASREILILVAIALVLDGKTIKKVVEVTNDLLDAAGFKKLR